MTMITEFCKSIAYFIETEFSFSAESASPYATNVPIIIRYPAN